MTGFANAADSLANNRIVNFDADSYITGAAPRYVGAPDAPMELPFDRPLTPCTGPGFLGCSGFNARLSSQPSRDAFVSRGAHSKSSVSPWIVGVLGSLGLITLAGVIFKDKKDVKSPNKVDAAKVTADTGAEKTASAAVKEKATTALGKTKNAASSAWSKIKNFKVPTWGKVALGATAGLMVLYGAFKALSKPSINTQSFPDSPKYPQY